MRISHEAIYQALFVQGRGALRRELTARLRTWARVADAEGAHARARQGLHLSRDHDQPTSRRRQPIATRRGPLPLGRRPYPGSWEFGDRHLGGAHDALHSAAIPAAHGGPWPRYSREERARTRRSCGAEAVRDAISRTIVTLPEQLRRSLTLGSRSWEMAQHARLKIEAGVRVHFCDPHSPWQRGTNQVDHRSAAPAFPQRDRSQHAQRQRDTAAVAAAPNSRSRKTLDWKTPAEALDRFLPSSRQRSCCDHRLNPPNTSPSDTPSVSPKPGSSLPSAASATLTTVRVSVLPGGLDPSARSTLVCHRIDLSAFRAAPAGLRNVAL